MLEKKTKKNTDHYGNNSMFVGVSESKGECFGVCGFSLSSIPKNAIITSASISFYPMNRVSVQVESFGEWRVGQIDERTIDNISSFDEIKNVKSLSYIDRPTGSAQLSQGIWRTYTFASQELRVLQKSLLRSEALFRFDGPSTLPIDRASQLMQWDIGYGKFSGGLTYRPKLDISYTVDEAKIELKSSREFTAINDKILESKLLAGYDENCFKKYACLEFDLSQWPEMDNTIISSAYLEIEAIKIDSKNTLRFHIEMIVPSDGVNTYEKIQKREIIERIGYDVSVLDVKSEPIQRFVFDTYAINEMAENVSKNAKAYFVISATSQVFLKNQDVKFMDTKRVKRPSLVIKYIKKRRNPPQQVENLTYSIESNIIKLKWDLPNDDGYKGAIVVKNPFKVPCTAYDGQKLYGGMDDYTYDNFGDKDMHKYYAVFSYDDVPNFSEPVFIEINSKEKS